MDRRSARVSKVRKLTYYIGSSLDGFIADTDGGLGRFQVGPELIEFTATEYPETLPGQVREQLKLERGRSSTSTPSCRAAAATRWRSTPGSPARTRTFASTSSRRVSTRTWTQR